LEIPLNKIAQAVGGQVIGDGRMAVRGINSLEAAVRGELSFYTDKRFKESLRRTQASAVMVSEFTELFHGAQIIVSNPELGYAKAMALFFVAPPSYPGISDRAFVHARSRMGRNVSIYPGVYVGEDAIVGDHVILFPGVFIGDRVRIGDRSVLHPNVTVLRDCRVGKEVIIHAGTVVGSDGFGFVRDGSRSVKIPQIGTVQIDDQVEIGANNCIDRATFGKTWIKRGVKTDNMVHVGHNVVVGEDSIIVAQAALAGSVEIGRGVIIGGQVAVADHLKIGDGAMIGSQSGVAQSIGPGEVVSGTPSMPHRLWLKTSRLITRLPRLAERLRNLEKRVEEIQKGSK
jgi:UDP-3-O-[3-hydroxymyristoyl] glucosamine N-acyltransferase